MTRTINDRGKTSCEQCGICCTRGGPALHMGDLSLVRDHRISRGDLITIRAGEPVFSPLVDGIEPSRTELIKVSGLKDSWTCRFFSRATKNCGIYTHRPQECRLLQCWDTTTLTRVIYHECMTREHIVPSNENLWHLIEIQEEHCSFTSISRLAEEFQGGGGYQVLKEIERVVTLDLEIRQRAMQQQRLDLADELLFFGRPLFKSLSYYHLKLQEGPQGLRVIPGT
jgi:Fe-S-cluster containining protein